MNSERSLCVVGLGEVGLRLAISFADAGVDVVGIDVDEERVAQLEQGESYISDIPDADIATLRDAGFEAHATYDELDDVSHVAICVPTPLQKSGQPDISYVLAAAESLAERVGPECTIIIESTVYPTATEDVIAEVFETHGFIVGEDIFLASSPERVDPGNEDYHLTEIPKVVGGVTEQCADNVEALYGDVFESLVRVDSATEAEMAKILENTFRNVNIALVNELVKVANNFDINFWRIIDAAKTKPYGFMPFYPGPGLGGHCIPVDPLYLSWKARQDGLNTPLIDLADSTNREMSEYIVLRTTEHLNERRVPLPNADILILGVAYKPDVPDVRNSPAIDIIDQLEQRNATVSYHDPYVEVFETPDNGTYTSEPLTAERLADADCVLVVTDHSEYDMEFVVEHASLVFDTRNATDGIDADNVRLL
ncbi:nucleotide sugar dehydrogenase [Haloplanus aerogenes]|uniref:UDP-N-acetyl-D-mannosamine dehydrogenase n=1 Tax=Haloplanus aerogenes TaxID=660522 RepID=A0A3M0D9B1_9EURY|nr:nucleotide sugar dehydrogenase [Haloplanus aerogenes]AZH26323.1 nucleotide sugar dehydrogenase [Haloplanus aerogenes]RMB18218.1 UDP-N-acetyl-D-glucosamine dehydrogenase [Haloplanus aerogenes]